MTEFKVKDCFICNFCRNICNGGCNEIKERLLSGNVDKDSQFYKDNIDLYQNKDSKPPIDVLIKAIKYLGNKCNDLIEKYDKK